MSQPLTWARQRSSRRVQQVLIYSALTIGAIVLARSTLLSASPDGSLASANSLIRTWKPTSYFTGREDNVDVAIEGDDYDVGAENAATHQLSPNTLPTIHLLMPTNKGAALKKNSFCRAAVSAFMNGYKPAVYNWGGMANDIQKTHRQKVSVLKDILDSPDLGWGEGDLVLVMDSLDVWLQLPPEDLARRYASYDQDLVIVSAEKHCVPNPWDSPDCQNAPESPLPADLWTPSAMKPISGEHSSLPRHANSGCILGRVDVMRKTFAELAEIVDDPEYPYTGDQGAFNTLLGRGHLAVDHYSRLFWAAAGDDKSLLWLNTPIHPDAHILPDQGAAATTDKKLHTVMGAPIDQDNNIIPWDRYPTLGYHRMTGQIPVALHGNGYRGKDLLDESWGVPWFSNPRNADLFKPRLKDAKIDILRRDGSLKGQVSMHELCWDKLQKMEVWEGPPEVYLDDTPAGI